MYDADPIGTIAGPFLEPPRRVATSIYYYPQILPLNYNSPGGGVVKPILYMHPEFHLLISRQISTATP